MCNRYNNGNFNNFSNSNYNSYNNEFGGGFNSSNYNATNMRYGYAYVPNQAFNNVFTPAQGLANGTMFPELVSPYFPNQSMETMNYLRYNSNNGGCYR
jgi:hypothetical protein